MATNTLTLKIHFNIHDVRQVQLAEQFNEVIADNCRMFDSLKAELVKTQPDHATVAWLTDMINKDFEELSKQTDKEFAVAKRDSEDRFEELQQLTYHSFTMHLVDSGVPWDDAWPPIYGNRSKLWREQ